MQRILLFLFLFCATGLAAAQGTTPSAPATTPIALDPHPLVALTFDDLPAAGALPAGDSRTAIATKLTKALRDGRVEGAYGFINAAGMQNNPDAQRALKIWVDAGMHVGSHTWSHLSLNTNTPEAFEHEIELNEPALKEYSGTSDWHWFRYPFLAEGDTPEKYQAIKSYLKDHGYRVAEVTLSFGDYEWNEPYTRCLAKGDTAGIEWLKQSYLDMAAEYIAQGRKEQVVALGHEIPNVMLLHGMAFTALMMPDLLKLLDQEGFRFAPLEEVERDSAYSHDPDTPLPHNGLLTDHYMVSGHFPYPSARPRPTEKLKDICR